MAKAALCVTLLSLPVEMSQFTSQRSGSIDNRVSDIDEGQAGNTEDESDEDLGQQTRQQTVREATNLLTLSTSQSAPGLILRQELGEYVPRHTYGQEQVYIYRDPDQDKNVTVRERDEFLELRLESSSHITFGSTRRKAKAWESFVEGISVKNPFKAKVVCKFCGIIMSHPQTTVEAKSGMAGLVSHVAKCSQKGRTTSKQASMAEYLDSGDCQAFGFVYTKDRLLQAQLSLAVGLNLPFTVFESPEFYDFCDVWKRSPNGAAPDATIADRRQLAAYLGKATSEARIKQAEELAKNKSRISISLDGWTSPNDIPYVGIVAHYINNEFELRRETIAFEVINGSHTGETYCDLVWEILEKKKLLGKVCVTYDASFLASGLTCHRFIVLPVILQLQTSR